MRGRRTTRIWTDGSNRGYAGPVVAALLGVAAGVVAAAGLLVFQPVRRVKELPRPSERSRGTVYFVEGNRDAGRLATAPDKIQFLLRGQWVTFGEEDFNALLEAALARKPKAPADEFVTLGIPNVRVRDGVIQLATEVTIDLAGLKRKVVLQTRGTMHEYGGQWVFEPAEMLVGSLPLERVPLLGTWVRARVLNPRELHPDLAVAWSRLGRVVVEGSTVKVSLR